MSENTRTVRTPKGEPSWWAPFLEVLTRTCNVVVACKAVGVGRRTAYDHRARSDSFRDRWDDAIEAAVDTLEAEARRRALQGTEKGIYHQGKKIDTVREYSDTLLIFLLKAHRPERFRDSFAVKRLVEEYTAARKGGSEPTS